ncbi:hypothetical protein Ahy_A10g048207 [Arachis hypogaea]|uniref:Mei2-like C-terminal RNA recognition motif domain-containing protein n=1 Tax=Arachis hypogaea TaxID=3818 RepID=A0A445B4K4_ARAHY|nr:hypothetical protein Ahy_A10g048207 [Arachis hypogaea]
MSNPIPLPTLGWEDQLRGVRGYDEEGGQVDSSKKQFHLDLDKIKNSEDRRTTLMIKNIPNKYTSKMLLATIDEKHKGTYDFFYLPINFKNKCNVGYTFINILSASHIIPFYETFTGKKLEKFNSEKTDFLFVFRVWDGIPRLKLPIKNSSESSTFQGNGGENLPRKNLSVTVVDNDSIMIEDPMSEWKQTQRIKLSERKKNEMDIANVGDRKIKVHCNLI